MLAIFKGWKMYFFDPYIQSQLLKGVLKPFLCYLTMHIEVTFKEMFLFYFSKTV